MSNRVAGNGKACGDVAVINNKKLNNILQMNIGNKDELTNGCGNSANAMLGDVFKIFFLLLWILAFAAWIVFVCKGIIFEMFVANSLMWIGAIGLRYKK